MPHIHKHYDFVVTVFVVHKGRVLLVHHRSYDKWLPIGGHIELNEDPEEALYREIREECGLKVRILAPKVSALAEKDVKPIPTPAYVDVHRTHARHRHVAFIYFGTSRTSRVRLCTDEHREYRWFSPRDLAKHDRRLRRSIRFYALKALEAAR